MTGQSGAAVVAGVTGRPIAHSLSPRLQGLWIEAAGLDAAYGPFLAEDEAAFDALIEAGRRGLIRGLNVTAPWKARALAAADAASPTAARAGSANLLLFDDGQVRADSTDGAGLLAALAEQAPTLRLAGARATVLGAGGAARAAAAALIDAGASVGIVNRSAARAEELAHDLGVDIDTEADASAADLIVNALPVRPTLDMATLRAGSTLMDMTYRPLLTPWLAAGRARGLTVVDGLAMLIGQARPSFQALFGRAPPEGLDVRAALVAAMEAGG